jgi:5-methylcytosine-specific restriction endonuclease McrA
VSLLPLRPCRVCRQPAPDGRCPHHPPTANTYRPHRPSTASGAYNGPWPTLRLACLDRDNWTCRYCGTPANTADHIQPRTRGGPTTLTNLAAACQPCNRSKKDKTLAQWIATGNAPAGAIELLKRAS